jgi:hypothetical protein
MKTTVKTAATKRPNSCLTKTRCELVFQTIFWLMDNTNQTWGETKEEKKQRWVQFY